MCWVRFTWWTQQPCRAAELHSVSQHCGSLWGVLAWRTRGCISRVKGGNLTWFAPPLLCLRTERDEREDEGGEDGQRGRRGLMRSGSVFREDVYRKYWTVGCWRRKLHTELILTAKTKNPNCELKHQHAAEARCRFSCSLQRCTPETSINRWHISILQHFITS